MRSTGTQAVKTGAIESTCGTKKRPRNAGLARKPAEIMSGRCWSFAVGEPISGALKSLLDTNDHGLPRRGRKRVRPWGDVRPTRQDGQRDSKSSSARSSPLRSITRKPLQGLRGRGRVPTLTDMGLTSREKKEIRALADASSEALRAVVGELRARQTRRLEARAKTSGRRR
jgi:hypothetical protein